MEERRRLIPMECKSCALRGYLARIEMLIMKERQGNKDMQQKRILLASVSSQILWPPILTLKPSIKAPLV